MTDILQDKLDHLSDKRRQLVTLPQQQLDALCALVDPDDAGLADQVRALVREFDSLKTVLQAEVGQLEDAIKQAVLAQGASASGAYLQALIIAPRITWDTKQMEVYRRFHPEVDAYRKVGEPSVQIRAYSPQKL